MVNGMSSSSFVPCKHPTMCGVATHRAGSAAARNCGKITNVVPVTPRSVATPATATLRRPEPVTGPGRHATHNFGFGDVLAKQHMNPDGTQGGWVALTATVAPTATIGENVKVHGSAKVLDDAWVGGNAEVYGNAEVSGKATIAGNAKVHGDAVVSGNAAMSGNSQALQDAKVFGSAVLDKNAKAHGNAEVYGNAALTDTSEAFGDSEVYGSANLAGNTTTFGDAHVTSGTHHNASFQYGLVDDSYHRRH